MGQVERIQGVVRMVKSGRGYGFILPSDGKQIWFHKMDIRPTGGERKLPPVGSRVAFVVQPITVPGQRDRAIDVEVL